MKQKQTNSRRGRYFFSCLAFLVLLYQFNTISIRQDVVVGQGDTYNVFFRHMSWLDAITTKFYLKFNSTADPILFPGVYRFDKPLSHKEFVSMVTTPPKPVMAKVTLLEGRSTWDYDALLQKQSYAKAGEYRAYITNSDVIKSASQKYPFLSPSATSLEGFLYPDTYHIDLNKGNVVQQLVELQLQNFSKKVRLPYEKEFKALDAKLQQDDLDFKLSTYSVIKLASIIENEEKNNNNKPTIAGIFLNRIDANMQLGADVTLCYGKSITYDKCTPSFIVEHLYDDNNPYNTRRQSGLTPTPISNPTLTTILSVLRYQNTDYFYYLHDNKGNIYYGATLEQHNTNKNLYLR